MKIILGKTAGFCYGVKRAVDGAMTETDNNKNIYCLGEIVHNKSVIKELEQKGVEFIDDINQAKEKVIIRAHGVPKEVYEKAKNSKIEIIDFTCPHVLKIHKIAEEYSSKGYFIILLGKKTHPEVIGIESFCGKNKIVIQDEDEVQIAIKTIENSGIPNIVIIAQTTYNSKKFDKIVNEIKENIDKNIKIEKTICPATETRQKETEEISKKVDVMIIIGDKKSSNTNKLYDIACSNCKKVMFIQNRNELNFEEIKNSNKIGIMAGASTPNKDIEEVIIFLENGGTI